MMVFEHKKSRHPVDGMPASKQLNIKKAGAFISHLQHHLFNFL